MPRAYRNPATIALTLACLLVVSFGGAAHHHTGDSPAHCAVCHAAAGPALVAPSESASPAPETGRETLVADALRVPDRVVASTAPARAPPVSFSDAA
jgi:hypothetical protein